MRLLAKASLGAALLIGSYYLYQRPEIRVLFATPKEEGDPLAFLNDLPEIKPNSSPKQPNPRYRPRKLEPVPESETPPAEQEAEPLEEEFINQVPNDQLRRVFLQILAAKKLAHGVSLSVTDDQVLLMGVVDTAEKRQQILDIIDRGREARRIDGQRLMVKD
jgi:hypothetical protein